MINTFRMLCSVLGISLEKILTKQEDCREERLGYSTILYEGFEGAGNGCSVWRKYSIVQKNHDHLLMFPTCSKET